MAHRRSTYFSWHVASAVAGLLLVPGCSGDKTAYRQAGEVHARPIAYVAALAPFLSPREGLDEASMRHAARQARAEIVKHALESADYRRLVETPGARLSPSERIAGAFFRLSAHCTLTDPRDSPAEQDKTTECLGAVRELGGELDRIAAEADRLHLPLGTIPRLTLESITPEARKLQNALYDTESPVLGELARRRLWQDPHATDAALREACAAALREARTRPQGVYEELSVPCNLLQQLAANLALVAACQKQKSAGCMQPSLCGMVLGYAQRTDDLPASYGERARAAAAICQARMGLGEGGQQPEGAPVGPSAETGPDAGIAAAASAAPAGPGAADGGPGPSSRADGAAAPGPAPAQQDAGGAAPSP